jgi:uncharacterized protein
MIAIDTNIPVCADRGDAPLHAAACARLAACAEGRAAWAIPQPCRHEFFAIASHPRIHVPPPPAARAIDRIDAWLESPSPVLLAETGCH